MENKMHGSEENELDAHWSSIRKRTYDDSFDKVATWIREMHQIVRSSPLEKRKRKRRILRFVLFILPLFFILSCTIRINRVETSGNLVSFSINKKENSSFQKLSSLQQVLTFSCYEFLQPDQPAIAYFIFYVPIKEQQKLFLIIEQLKALNGLQKLDISSINYTIRESLFLSFWHETFKLREAQQPKGKELTRNIQASLKNKGLGFLSIVISNDEDGEIAFTSTKHNPDSLTLNNNNNLAGEKKNAQKINVSNKVAGIRKLQIFNWLLGSWKVKYVPQTYHHWLRINDSLLVCFIIKYPDEGLINYGDDGPDISIGFSIRYSKSDSAILSLRGIEWRFLSANEKEIHFKNEITPKSARVKWSLADEKKSWQSVISGESNLEIVNLMRDEHISLEHIAKEFMAKHPELIRKT